MAVISCDICGGSLSMDASGDFAICESCGMKHTKDRVKAMAQEIAGTVKVSNLTHYQDIWEAAEKGIVQDVAYFVENGTDVDAARSGFTPLDLAIMENSNMKVIEYLVSKGADVNHALYEAVKSRYNRNSNYLEILKYLVSQGADVNVKREDGNTPLHNAVRNGFNEEALKFLVSQSADINAKNNKGERPVDLAFIDEKQSVLKIFSQFYGSSSFPDIFEAARKGTVQDVKIFVMAGTDVNGTSNTRGKYTPLQEAAYYNPNVDVLKYLVSAGADVNAKDSYSNTPLHMAIKNNSNTKVLKYLVSARNVNTKGKYGNTPLHTAVKSNYNVEILEYLVSKGADVNEKNINGYTPLHIAVESNSKVDVLKYLVSKGADVNVKSNLSDTPLHLAASRETNLEVLEFLVSAGADVFMKDYLNRTPLDIAKTDEKKRILREPMAKRWRKGGFCEYCGGDIGLFSNKCKSCGKKN